MSNILINADVWNDTSVEESREIKAILVQSGLIKEDDELVADPSTPEVYESDEASDSPEGSGHTVLQSVGNACHTPCKAARDVARASCGAKYPFSSKKRRKCREAVERAYIGCLALCDM